MRQDHELSTTTYFQYNLICKCKVTSMLSQDRKHFKSLCGFVCVLLYCNDRERKEERGTESDRSGEEITRRDKEMWTVEEEI